MTTVVNSQSIQYPVQGVLHFGYGSGVLYALPAFELSGYLEGTLAAQATVTLLAANPNNGFRFGKVLFSVDAGGPYFFTALGNGNFRLRNTPPFFVELDFTPFGSMTGVNTALTLKNEHASVAGNYEIIIFYTLDIQ